MNLNALPVKEAFYSFTGPRASPGTAGVQESTRAGGKEVKDRTVEGPCLPARGARAELLSGRRRPSDQTNRDK
ncbi:unnamed protein product [Arctogadus glacialis]